MKRGSKRQSRGNNVVPSSQAPESEEKELPEDIKELLELIPEEKRSTALRKLSLTRVNTESYAGPLPHPQILAGYNQVIPGSADRIIQQAEDQAKHRQRLESMLAEQGVKQEKRGQWFGFILGALSMGAGTFLTYSGHDAVGGTIFATTVIGLASVFLTGQKIKTKQ